VASALKVPALMPLAALMTISGCVLPLGPEFEGDRNLPPFLVSVTPPQASIVSVEGRNVAFHLVVEDPNPRDTLYVRWLIDYPLYNPAVSRIVEGAPLPPVTDGTSRRTIAPFTPDCLFHQIAHTGGEHRLLLAVSDRPFYPPQSNSAPPGENLDAAPEDAGVLRMSWTFILDCP
jgi:hypothetical protein